ncbi:MAG: bifunctional hydroxymethylpyrimidine kinase/phosphomethylpyrimidine kinase [Gammaproteobacteria bacterium]|nr:bifunctional hydroxymethylpyrimidine kinase/phosphomethylpyrimidine kinase [Gammaproteobacteria bacterium]
MAIPIALTIAGSDSGGGAGVQADLKTFSANRVYGASVITALTAQNTREVRAIEDATPEFIAHQLDCVAEDLAVDAVKVGMLSRVDTIGAVAAGLERHQLRQVVVDPVMVAKSGDALLAPQAVDALRQTLMPLAKLITPNLPEAGVLLNAPAPTDEGAMREAARRLMELGCAAVLVKGGHLSGERNIDILFDGADFTRFENTRVNTKNTHGTGCTLSSAIAARLAHGDALEDAVGHAIRYVHEAIAMADELSVGSGHGPVHHFYQLWG